ncbi:hypothetical protein [Aeromonas phage AS-yj]|uniref:Uncharacterized protein n=1 Tax=Aeromonas phage AS-yj TaxID=2026115 RepID=A0A291LF35_9CAUD|nr:hypothetical protein [Aeromonas phage AS-yj]
MKGYISYMGKVVDVELDENGNIDFESMGIPIVGVLPTVFNKNTFVDAYGNVLHFNVHR